jgi:hypothetical protein
MKPKTLLLIALLLSFVGCSGNSQQQQAFDAAYQFEQGNALFAGPMALAIIQNYEAVIQLDPNSAIAKRAQERVDIAQKNWNDYLAQSRATISH